MKPAARAQPGERILAAARALLTTSAALAGALACTAAPVSAHVREDEAAHAAAPATAAAVEWTWEPVTTALLVATALLYVRGARELRRRSAAGRTPSSREVWWFAAGWLSLAGALVSPLHALGQELFSAHMVQHEVLMLVAAPLLVLSRPLPVILWGLPAAWRPAAGGVAKTRPVSAAWRFLSDPLAAWTIHGAALWIWHVPSLFESTLTSELSHAAQHASFFGSALLFWWALVHRRADALGAGAAMLYVFTTMLHSGLLGALLTFAGTPWYDAYLRTSEAWGLSALEDQQLGGLVMWIPAGLVYVAAGLLLVLAWLRDAEQRTRRRAFVRSAGVALAPVWPAAAAAALAGATALSGCGDQVARDAMALTGGDPERGRVALREYGCAACHSIPGVTGAEGVVGPPLDRVARRVYLAGRLTNTPDAMIRWILDPQHADPKTAMPDVGASERDARDMTAYLYTLR